MNPLLSPLKHQIISRALILLLLHAPALIYYALYYKIKSTNTHGRRAERAFGCCWDSIGGSAGRNVHPYTNAAEVISWINQCPLDAVCSVLTTGIDKSSKIIRTFIGLRWCDTRFEPKTHMLASDTAYTTVWHEAPPTQTLIFFKTFYHLEMKGVMVEFII